MFIDYHAGGNLYYLGYFKSAEGTEASIILANTQLQPVSYFLEAPGVGEYHNGTVDNNVAIIHLNDSVVVLSHVEQDKGIYLTTTDSDGVNVIGQTTNTPGPSHDTFLALPLTNLCAMEYVYYGISTNRTTLVGMDPVPTSKEDFDWILIKPFS